MNRSEQIKIESALESVETLKSKVKKQMATRRIVDLTAPAIKPKAEESKESLDEQQRKKEAETYNCMVMNARG